jgi:hypothetical protein
MQPIVVCENELLSDTEHYQVHDRHGELVIELVDDDDDDNNNNKLLKFLLLLLYKWTDEIREK